MKNKNPYFDQLANIIKSLPGKPGVYQYYDKDGKIIYVGKAKHLKKRVSSYFNKDQTFSGKVGVLVKKIANIEVIVVDTEFDALLLENNLIKKYQPRYNVMMKDDKTFPWICIKKERFPRIFSTRHIIKDGSLYFGPYASVRMMKTVLDLVKQLYPLRNCNYKLSEKNISNKKFKECLEFHLGNCLAPCIGKQIEEDYNQTIAEITDIIKGNISSVAAQLRKLMKLYADSQEFEKAQVVKEKLELLNRYKSKSTIVNPKLNNIDVFSIVSDDRNAFINFLKVVNGAIVQSHSVELKKKLDETDSELLAFAITDLHQRFDSNAKEIIISQEILLEIPNVTFTIPQRGDKKHLLELSFRNAKYYKLDKQKQKSLVDPERHSKRILSQMMKDLRLKELPVRIECFDNSNMQGDYAVAAMVSFKNAKPDKKEYRHYNIKTVTGPDDFASMAEIIYRRYNRLINEEKELPQLIVVDGGKGQLSAALQALNKLKLRGQIAIIGIAKRLEEIYFPGDSIPLYIDKKSETLKTIQYLRDEAHRFGIAHHRKKMEKGIIKSVLTEIDGIGYSTAQKLLWKFKSVQNIQNAKIEDIEKTIGHSKAMIIINYFEDQA